MGLFSKKETIFKEKNKEFCSRFLSVYANIAVVNSNIQHIVHIRSKE